ncbi:MAG: dihydroorotate dehydrogenase-like protein [Anaerolineales bacterium]|nr:dihydroorotate dehydrogenase-like protein [Anaerolineales bacterium]
MTDLSTTYLGLKLKNPLVASSSPFSKKIDAIREMEDAGLSAVVMHSLFEEQIAHESNELDHFLSYGTDSFAEALTYFPDLEKYNLDPDAYLELIRKARAAVQIPVIASLNGITSGGWVETARRIEQAGASALELNLYYLPTDPNLSGAELEEEYLRLVRDVRAKVRIPLAVKLSPFFTAIPQIAKRMAEAGADGLVLFNRFYQPDLDLEKLEVTPSLELSTSNDLLLPLRWTAILYGRVKADLALTGGVHTGRDLIKAVMAGAAVAMATSSLVRNGLAHAGAILKEADAWMTEHEYASVRQMQGSLSQKSVAQPAAFERANYMKVLQSYDDRMPR